ncbi:MAG: BACON domain-containing protein [Bacteroidaceae bacterium]|nr:BACON domain-containing protein [Bacteroidaceae bacterium]
MKKFLFALLAIMGISASCTSSYEEWYLTVSDQSGNYIISAEGQTNTIVLTTTSSVDLSCNEDWVHLGTTSYNVEENGKRYELYPEVTFDANTTGEIRAAIIYFDNGGPEKLSLPYTQLANSGE